MSWTCEFWNPKQGKARSCDLAPGEECPYTHYGGCYEDENTP
jgi:hypothetical protein